MDTEPTTPQSSAERIMHEAGVIAQNIKDKPMKLVDVYTSDEERPPKVTPAAIVSIIQGTLEIPDENVLELDLSSASQVEKAWQSLRQVDQDKLFVFKYPDNLDKLNSDIGLGSDILDLYLRIQANYFTSEKTPANYTIIQFYGDSLIRALSKRKQGQRITKAGSVPKIELNPIT